MSPIEQLQEEIRAVRGRYDDLKRGQTASIRHCRTAGQVALEEVYWTIGRSLARDKPDLAHVVLLFPLAPQRRGSGARFSFGRFLRQQLGDGDGASLRFRRLLACSDHDELDHQLRRVLRLACADKTPVDWGVVGADILWFGDRVRRNWAQNFYAPSSRNDADVTAAPTSNA